MTPDRQEQEHLERALDLLYGTVAALIYNGAGRCLGSIPHTPSDTRSLVNSFAEIRRHGGPDLRRREVAR